MILCKGVAIESHSINNASNSTLYRSKIKKILSGNDAGL